jgi:hypothetical protein
MKTLFERFLSFPDKLIQELQSIKNEITAAHHTYKATADKKQAEPIVHVLSRSQAERDEEESRHKEERRYQKRTLWIQGIYTLVTAVIAVATFISVRTAQNSASVSKDNAEAALKQSRLEQRAWIGVTATIIPLKNKQANPLQPLVPLEPLIDSAFSLRFIFKNTGRTPAVNMRPVVEDASMRSQPDQIPEPNFTLKNGMLGHPQILVPEASFVSDLPSTMDRKAFEEIITLRRRVFVFGRVEYDDVFSGHHWYNFCMYLTPGGSFANCPFHNEIDQN